VTAPDYSTLLADPVRSGVFQLPAARRQDITSAAEQLGFVVFHVDLGRARDKEDLLEFIGSAMAFPEWFGHNFDAFLDCLADLGWRPAMGYLVLLEHCDAIRSRAESDFLACLQTFSSAAAEWRERGIAFWCLVEFEFQSNGAAWLPSLE
jgi:RNAse (barnase) inhibitor barstar